MKQSVNFSDFRDAFHKHERHDQFSHECLVALFDYLEEYELETGEEIELDVVGLCCEFAEYDSANEACSDYQLDVDDLSDDEAFEVLSEYTTVLRAGDTGGVVVRQF